MRRRFVMRDAVRYARRPSAERAAILTAGRDSNRDLLHRYRPDLPADAYDDDAGTIALGRFLAPIELVWPPPRNSRPDLTRRVKKRAYRRWRRLTAAS